MQPLTLYPTTSSLRFAGLKIQNKQITVDQLPKTPPDYHGDQTTALEEWLTKFILTHEIPVGTRLPSLQSIQSHLKKRGYGINMQMIIRDAFKFPEFLKLENDSDLTVVDSGKLISVKRLPPNPPDVHETPKDRAVAKWLAEFILKAKLQPGNYLPSPKDLRQYLKDKNYPIGYSTIFEAFKIIEACGIISDLRASTQPEIGHCKVLAHTATKINDLHPKVETYMVTHPPVPIRLEPEILEKLEAMAEQAGESIHSVVNRLIAREKS